MKGEEVAFSWNSCHLILWAAVFLRYYANAISYPFECIFPLHDDKGICSLHSYIHTVNSPWFHWGQWKWVQPGITVFHLALCLPTSMKPLLRPLIFLSCCFGGHQLWTIRDHFLNIHLLSWFILDSKAFVSRFFSNAWVPAPFHIWTPAPLWYIYGMFSYFAAETKSTSLLLCRFPCISKLLFSPFHILFCAHSEWKQK